MARRRRSYLDDIWRRRGADHLIRLLYTLSESDRFRLLDYVNDDRLSFPVFFTMIKELSKLCSFFELSSRNLAAVQICADKMTIPGWEQGMSAVSDQNVLRESLLWMFHTGKSWDGPSSERDEFDMMLDYVASLLVITYDDRTILPDIADIIFLRNRRGLLIHDLVWCFFQSPDQESASYLAKRILSVNYHDVELACSLLHLDPPESINRTALRKKYNEYIEWLAENRPYLYLTGEHFQQTSSPKHLDIDLEAKYLGKAISPRDRTPIEPLSDSENECLYNFRASSEQDQQMLTEYSCKLRRQNKQQWDEWMQKEISGQVLEAQQDREVSR